MRILYAHNFYRTAGGEDEIFADEIRLMRSHGHHVSAFESSSKIFLKKNKLIAGLNGVWSLRMANAMRRKIRDERPDILHVHNYYPIMSPSIFRAAAAEGVAVVHTLHNYRMICSHAGFYRKGRICEDCVGSPMPWRGVIRGCNHNGRAADAQIAVTIGLHRLWGTWNKSIDRYIALTPFARDFFIKANLPAEKIELLPTYVDPDPGTGPGGNYALFVGRFSVEKGLRILLDAWRNLDGSIPLKIVGTGGPLAEEVAATSRNTAGVEFKGMVSRQELTKLMKEAACLIFPSVWYEGTPRTIAESFAVGTPVIASDIGAMRLMVTPDFNGQWFDAGNANELARAVKSFFATLNTSKFYRTNARKTFELNYSAQGHYERLKDIYEAAISNRRAIINAA